MYMKWYFASRTRHQEQLRNIADQLEQQGETITSRWLYIQKFESYDENRETIKQFAQDVVTQIQDADIFVLLSDAGGTDMFLELGVALGKHASGHPISIYIVGKHSKRSLMQLHPATRHVGSLGEVFEKEGITVDVSGFDVSFYK